MILTAAEQAALKASIHELIDRYEIVHFDVRNPPRRVAVLDHGEPTERRALIDSGVRLLFIEGYERPDPEIHYVSAANQQNAEEFEYEFDDSDDEESS